MILEYKDVQFFKAEEIKNDPLTLRISGLAFHSALAVKKIVTEVNGHTLNIFVYLTKAKSGLSGNFEYDIIIPESVSEINFGKNGYNFWRRKHKE